MSLLQSAALDKGMRDLRVCHGVPKINHILFADDNLIFCKADTTTSLKVLEILKWNERVSGQCINTSKITMVFSWNVPNSLKEKIMNLWGSNHQQQYEKYLGLSPFIGKVKRRAFVEIKGKLWQRLRLNSWKGNLLSQGGREILIKSVALAIPTFATRCFLFPKALCSELERLVAKF